MGLDMSLWDVLLGGAVLAVLVWAARACVLGKGQGRGCMGGCAHCPRRAEGRCVWRDRKGG